MSLKAATNKGTGAHTMHIRRRLRTRRKRLAIACVLFICFLFTFWPPAVVLFWGEKGLQTQLPLSQVSPRTPPPFSFSSGSNAHATVHSVRVQIGTNDEAFDHEAIRLVKMSLQRRKRMLPELMKHVPGKAVLRCALLSLWAIKACSTAFREVYHAPPGQGGGALVTVLFPSNRSCHGTNTTSIGTKDILEGSNRSIVDQIPRQIIRMRKRAEASGLMFPASHALFEEVVRADVGRCGNASSDLYRGIFGDFGGAFSDVQVVSMRYLFKKGFAKFFTLEGAVDIVAGAATTTYFIMSHQLETWRGLNLTDTLFRTAEKKKCAFSQLSTDVEYEWKEGSPVGPLVIMIDCFKGIPFRQEGALEDFSSGGHQVDMTGGFTPSLLCEHLPNEIVLSRVIKYGEKTAVFHGLWREEKAIVKLFHPYQYFSFQDFYEFVQGRAKRSPLIHYPTFSCYSSKYDGIFQIQSVLTDHVTLQSLLSLKAYRKRVSFRQRLEIAIQIVCIFKFMHEEHPAGFFSYDDNHPSQYLLKRENDGFYTVRLIDIDTIQRGIAVPLANAQYPYSNVSTRCRCFYCHGRSNCMFFNTYEAYEACGQVSVRKAWSVETPHIVRHGRLCDGSSDIWFQAQLLFFLLDGTVAWQNLKREELILQIQRGVVPSLTQSSAAANHTEEVGHLLSRMFRLRPTETTVLKELNELCTAVGGCRRTTRCPPAVPLPAGGEYSSPLGLHMSR
ncbi:hypothetical protein MOQ_000360 [Trypanosoma cruzi marinkellei]|uniref:Protein kinase domain-containing protein n=1 Tax=Trypanosoma cruzi marinkellei TaxID=85056 RepID=K2MVY8_TRYCR|nr:hypothetical protein MOQ_000360 [Trypanosoma cruzi marinkellei]